MEAIIPGPVAEPDNETFRLELRDWLREHVVGEFAAIPGVGYGSDDRFPEIRIAWEKELVQGGWLGLTWPVEYGGRGYGIAKEIIFLEEITRARAPKWFGGPGRDLLAPMLLEFGTEEQKKRFLPEIMSAEQLWGQGFSEPGAGSDLASVATRAERVGDQWIINGQKIWMTFGHHADWIFMLTRTDPNAPTKHRGLTMLLVKADQPGIDIRPIRAITGTHEFAEAFFTDAVTSDDMVLGGVGQGWRVAMGTVSWERGLTTLPFEINFEHQMARLVEHVRASGQAADPVVRDRIAQSWINLQAVRSNTKRMLDYMAVGHLPFSTSIAKLLWANWHQEFGELATELAGDESLLVGPGYDLNEFQDALIGSRAETIYGGSNEIQKNIIGERVLGLPR